MTKLEFFACCIGFSFLALVWLLLGVPGVLCCISAMIVGNIDLSWIEAEETNATSELGRDSGFDTADRSGSNVSHNRDVPGGLVTGWVKIAGPALVKPARRCWQHYDYAAKVVQFRPRRVV